MKGLQVVGLVVLVSAIIAGCTRRTEEGTNLSVMGLEGEDKDVIVQTITSSEDNIAAQDSAQAPQMVTPAVPPPAPETAAAAAQMASESATASAQLDRNKLIQTALKNAGLYIGEIDGKIGPLTRKAIEEFQKNNNLKVDGKVGPVTWKALQKYLNAGAKESTVSTKRR